ncbi:MAG: hypothetical protein FJY10_08755 [Bacteroidetes bacterium]|nr:hypothetical protein [Bacteroidota bacterium]
MKKVLSFILVAGLVAMFACGPSAEEKAAREQAVKDSIAKVVADSIAQVEAAARAKFVADSTRIADSIANLPKNKKKTVKPQPKPEPVKTEMEKKQEQKKTRPGATKVEEGKK